MRVLKSCHLVVRRPTTRLLTQVECPLYPISLILGKMVSSWCICVQLQSSERVDGLSLHKHINWQSLKSKVTFSFLWWCGALSTCTALKNHLVVRRPTTRLPTQECPPYPIHWFWVKWSVLGAFASNYNLQRGLRGDHWASISTDNPWRAKWLSRSSDGVGHFSTCTALKNHLVVRRPTTRLLTQVECPPYPISLILGKMVSSWCICVQLQSSERVDSWSLHKHINWQSLKSKVTFSFLWWCGALFNMHSTEKPSCRRRPTTRLPAQECPPYPISLILGKMVSSWCICVQLQSSERVEGWSLGNHINWHVKRSQSLKNRSACSFLFCCMW